MPRESRKYWEITRDEYTEIHAKAKAKLEPHGIVLPDGDNGEIEKHINFLLGDLKVEFEYLEADGTLELTVNASFIIMGPVWKAIEQVVDPYRDR